MHYIGRFAPSPTGPLHLGSMMTAVASYLDAKHFKGEWLIRIEDLDPPREIAGAADSILKTLHQFGLKSDRPVIKQSERSPVYAHYLALLKDQALTYKCYCTRRDLLNNGGIHPNGGCLRQHESINDQLFSIRLQVSNSILCIQDLCQPPFNINLAKQAGDFILLRKDGLYAYHLGVTSDDAEQGVTHIVRGVDLLDSTPQQLFLQQCLNFPHPVYLHIPVITHADGAKFSKQTFAPSIEGENIEKTLFNILHILGQQPPKNLINKSKKEILQWGITHWSRTKIPKTAKISIENTHFLR